MLIVLGLVFGVAFFVCGATLTPRYWEKEGWWFATFFSSVFLFLALLVMMTNPVAVRSQIAGFHETARTIEAARDNPAISPLELAALQQSVIEQNQWLIRSQYWARHPLTNWFWPKVIFELKVIK